MGENVVALSRQSQGEIQVVPEDSWNLQPRSLQEAMEYAKILADSDFVPKDMKGKPGNVLVAVQMGQEVGLKPLQALQSIAVINGRPSVWGDGMLALILSAPDLAAFAEVTPRQLRAWHGLPDEELKDILLMAYAGREDIVEVLTSAVRRVPAEQVKAGTAICHVARRSGIQNTAFYSVSDAQTAQLWGKSGPWSQHPDRMLQMRARSFACRDVYADRLKGLSSAEESRDIRDVEARTGTGQGEELGEPQMLSGTTKSARIAASVRQQAEASRVMDTVRETARAAAAERRPVEGEMLSCSTSTEESNEALLSSVLAGIASAETEEELISVGERANQLPAESAERKMASAAYKDRFKNLRQAKT